MVGTDNGVYLGTNLDYPVDISVFEAYWNSSDNVSIIHWRTESETDVIGFYIYRSDEPDFSTAELISGLIPGQGTTTEPHDYYYEDEGIEPNPMDEYYYWLEVVDFDGMTHNYGPTHLVIPNCVLSTFVVEYLDNIPTLYWMTASETDNIGWNIYRSINDSSFVNAEMINIGLIPGYGTTSEPHSYYYEDLYVEANPGDVLWYWLESINFGGGSYIYYPPAYLIIPTAVEDSHLHLADIVLYQNHPNPFNGSTKISFSLPHPEKVKIQIYNLKGQLIETLLDENKTAGNHTFEWNAEEMSSGIYFMKLLTKERAIVRKLVIIK